MTYPPQQPYGQQPDPYGQQPGQQGQPQQPGQFGQQQPDPYGQQSSAYQGFGTYSGGPQPPKRNTAMIAAIIVAVLIVLAGGGTVIYFLTKGDDKDNAQASNSTTASPPPTTTSESTDTSTDDTTTEDSTDSSDATIAPDGTSPDSVRDDYILAYESKSFSSVVDNACSDYKTKYGTDTSDVEKQIAPYTIVGTPNGEPEVTGDSALAKIDLKFSKSGESAQTRSIKVKAVLEDGSWKFCGEADG